MKKLFILAIGLCCAASLTLNAASAPGGKKQKPVLTEEQKQIQKGMLEKYDTNKDGKLDKEEKAKISKEDKEKMKKAGLLPAPKKKDATTPAPAAPAPAAPAPAAPETK